MLLTRFSKTLGFEMSVQHASRSRSVAEDTPVMGDAPGPQGGTRPVDPGQIVEDVKGAAADLKTAAVQQGRALYETAREQATGFADQRKNDAAQSVSDLASSLRETGRSFDERPSIQAFVGGAADGLEQLATTIRDRSFAEIYGEVETYARRQPLAFAAVAATAGFFLARFIKASADDLSKASAASGRAKRDASARRAAAVDL